MAGQRSLAEVSLALVRRALEETEAPGPELVLVAGVLGRMPRCDDCQLVEAISARGDASIFFRLLALLFRFS